MTWRATLETHNTRLIIPTATGRSSPAMLLTPLVWRRASESLVNFGNGVNNSREFFIRQKCQKIGFELLCLDVELFTQGGCDNLITGGFYVTRGFCNRDKLFCQTKCFVFIEIFSSTTGIIGDATHKGVNSSALRIF